MKNREQHIPANLSQSRKIFATSKGDDLDRDGQLIIRDSSIPSRNARVHHSSSSSLKLQIQKSDLPANQRYKSNPRPRIQNHFNAHKYRGMPYNVPLEVELHQRKINPNVQAIKKTQKRSSQLHSQQRFGDFEMSHIKNELYAITDFTTAGHHDTSRDQLRILARDSSQRSSFGSNYARKLSSKRKYAESQQSRSKKNQSINESPNLEASIEQKVMQLK